MRNLISLLSLCLLALACEKEEVSILPVAENEVGLELHAITTCSGEFDINSESPEAWGQRVVDALTVQGLNITNFAVDFQEIEHPGFCGTCAPTGDILKITAPEEQAEELRALGFR